MTKKIEKKKSNHTTIAVKFGTKKLVAQTLKALKGKGEKVTSFDDVVRKGCEALKV